LRFKFERLVPCKVLLSMVRIRVVVCTRTRTRTRTLD